MIDDSALLREKGDEGGSQSSLGEDSVGSQEAEEEESSPGAGLGAFSYSPQGKLFRGMNLKRKYGKSGYGKKAQSSGSQNANEEDEKEKEKEKEEEEEEEESNSKGQDEDPRNMSDDDVIILDDFHSPGKTTPPSKVKQERLPSYTPPGQKLQIQGNDVENGDLSSMDTAERLAIARSVARKRKIEATLPSPSSTSPHSSPQKEPPHPTPSSDQFVHFSTQSNSPQSSQSRYFQVGDSHERPVKRRRCSSGPPFFSTNKMSMLPHHNPPSSLQSISMMKHEVIDVDTDEVEVIVTPIINHSPRKFVKVEPEEEKPSVDMEAESTTDCAETQQKDKGKEKETEEEKEKEKEKGKEKLDEMEHEEHEEDEEEKQHASEWEQRRAEWLQRPQMTSSVQKLFEVHIL